MQKEKFIGGVNFDELRAQRIKIYDTLTLDLSTARADEEIIWTGNYLYIIEATDIDTVIQIRLNEKFRSLLPMLKGRGIRAPFYRFYVTNAAQAGKSITLAIGIESETFEVFDVGKALSITGSIAEVTKIGEITKPVEITGNLYHTNLGKRFASYFTVTAGAGGYPVIILKNIGSSGEMILVEEIDIVDGGDQMYFIGSYATDGTGTPKMGKNLKLGGADSTIGQLNSKAPSDLNDLTEIVRFRGPSTAHITRELNLVIPNGARLAIIRNQTTSTNIVNAFWREI